MSIPNQYCGDEVMRESLRKVGSKLTLYQVYGLFSGCIAATNLVKPSQYYPMIFKKEGANFESEEEANKFLANLKYSKRVRLFVMRLSFPLCVKEFLTFRLLA